MPHRLQTPTSISVLGSLRALSQTDRRITLAEALRIAERQANLLLELRGIDSAPTPTEIISTLPKITVTHTGHMVWGASYWDAIHQTWVIELPSAEPLAHNRFTLAHEYKHIIDHGRQTQLYRGTRRTSADAQAEQAADYFAGCLLVPRKLLRAAWEDGMQTTGELADMFNVSEHTIGARLRQTQLADQHKLRHLPAPVPFIPDDEVDDSPDGHLTAQSEEGAIPA